jgi:hypothetical protein
MNWLLSLLLSSALAAPPVGADPALAPFFQSLHQPLTGAMCCSVADCRNVEVRQGPNGLEAFIDRKTFGQAAPDEWRAVPPEVVIRDMANQTGLPIACFYYGAIRCFLPATAT